MSYSEELMRNILLGEMISKEEAMKLANEPLDELTNCANKIREHFCKFDFDLCTIINGKCGKCSEDCKYCAQSSYYSTTCNDTYELLDTEKLLNEAIVNEKKGVKRYSIVTSGRKLSDAEVDKVCESIRIIKEKTNISVCISFGLLSKQQFVKLKKAGASRVHCNLETSKSYFPKVCTTHTYEEKIETLKAAKEAGLSICSGGILGLGESMEDRIDMILTARKLNVKSIPVNLLNPIKGTPYENNKILSNDELCRVVSIFRFIIPDASIRLAGGRGLLPDMGEKCFLSGANATISGDMLTTCGISIENDINMINKLGYKVNLVNN